jgi:hypothetical protein
MLFQGTYPGRAVFDSLRPIILHLFVAGIIGGLWFYADLERTIALGHNFRLPPVSNGTTSNAEAAPRATLPIFGPATRPADMSTQLGLADD